MEGTQGRVGFEDDEEEEEGEQEEDVLASGVTHFREV